MNVELTQTEIENVVRAFLSYGQGSRFEVRDVEDGKVRIIYGLGGGVCDKQAWHAEIIKQLSV